MLDIIEPLSLAIDDHRPVAVVTVVAVEGLPAFLVGKKLVVGPEGREAGSLGMEELDAPAVAEARQALAERKGAFSVTLAGPGGAREGMSARVFIDPVYPVPRLLVLGGGHIALPLVRIAALLDYEVTVVDDRPAFANRARFPEAREVVCEDFGRFLHGYRVTAGTYVVIVTRGHQHDQVCLEAVIDSPAAYIGMIGSRRRVRGVLTLLAEKGIRPALLDRVHAPIGLAIGAETPEEIALSIMAEIVKVRRGGTAPSLKGPAPARRGG